LTNTLAYYDTQLITVIKKFNSTGQGVTLIKLEYIYSLL
jgi:hypothetical protein